MLIYGLNLFREFALQYSERKSKNLLTYLMFYILHLTIGYFKYVKTLKHNL